MIYLASSWKNKYYTDVLAALRAAGHEVYDFRNPDNEPEPDGKGFNMPDGTLPAMASADCKCEHSSALAHGFTWTKVDPNCWEWTAEEYKANLTHPLAEKQFENDLRALEMCDTCVLVLPCGRSAHTEAGWMAGKGRRVMVLITDQDSFEAELMYKLFDDVCISTEELLEKLKDKDTYSPAEGSSMAFTGCHIGPLNKAQALHLKETRGKRSGR